MLTDALPRPVRVAIVEDHKDTADLLQTFLALSGFEVRVAYTGPDGVRLAQEWVPDVVLCDIGLPGLDGYGVALALRQHPATARVRLIAVTAYSSAAHRKRLLVIGFERYLVKPVDLRQLLQLLMPL